MYIECYMHENGIKIVAALPKLRYLHFFFKTWIPSQQKTITGSSIILNILNKCVIKMLIWIYYMQIFKKIDLILQWTLSKA